MKIRLSGKLYKHIVILMICIMSAMILSGCDSTKGEEGQTGEEGATEQQEGEAVQEAEEPSEPLSYDDYISNALSSVKPEESFELGAVDGGERPVIVNPEDIDEQPYVSASEALPESSGVTPSFETADDNDETAQPDKKGTDDATTDAKSSAEDDSASDDTGSDAAGTDSLGAATSDTGDNQTSDGLTPDEFEVGKSCIYIDGETDSSYGSDIITAINKARTDLGYPALTEKNGLNTCADRRTREIACFLSHMRPNATPFNSLAPQYFKAEMLAIDGAKPEETVDAWIRDPYSRSLLYTNTYTSVGAACFKCNGLNCVVVAFGY